MLPLFLLSVRAISGCGPSEFFGVREAPGVCVSEGLEVLLPALSLRLLESWKRQPDSLVTKIQLCNTKKVLCNSTRVWKTNEHMMLFPWIVRHGKLPIILHVYHYFHLQAGHATPEYPCTKTNLLWLLLSLVPRDKNLTTPQCFNITTVFHFKLFLNFKYFTTHS